MITSTPTNITYPAGYVSIDAAHGQVHEICGYNTERQDWIITPTSDAEAANKFKGYYCARFTYDTGSHSTTPHGVVRNATMSPGARESEGSMVGGYVAFPFAPNRDLHFSPTEPVKTKDGRFKTVVDVRVGTSFISIEQARLNIASEIPTGMTLEHTVEKVKAEWIEKLDRFKIEGATEEQKKVFWTGVAHALQYPSEQHEPHSHHTSQYFSGYDGKVHKATESYTGYSIWDTYRAEWAFLVLFAPERVPGMIRSMLADYKEGGWLPMWKNLVETNIMVRVTFCYSLSNVKSVMS